MEHPPQDCALGSLILSRLVVFQERHLLMMAAKVLQGMDKSKITRKPSKTGKHGHENGRVCKSRKPKSKSQSYGQPPVNLGQQKSTRKRQKLRMFKSTLQVSESYHIDGP
ncbi:hypothetical protein Tco_0876863 [Tanacetum coccineum]|uniref:Uncharacterized protein n=1 Tax=Tanacetum coccineum TaxID=301880 RepID=A0ABQ5BW62_9ASTR